MQLAFCQLVTLATYGSPVPILRIGVATLPISLVMSPKFLTPGSG
jgi:hypothetical protein